MLAPELGLHPDMSCSAVSTPPPCIVCRWLGFAASIYQRVPCHGCQEWKGCTLSPGEEQAVRDGHVPRLVPGAADSAPVPVRTSWTEPREVSPSTWVTGAELKYSAFEIMARGVTAEHLTAQVHNPTEERYLRGQSNEASRRNRADREQKCLGVRGRPLFSSLSYFKYALWRWLCGGLAV